MILAVECSVAVGSVAIFCGGECRHYREFPARMAGGTDAGAVIAAMLAEHGGEGITHCAVGIGPGSFSGIRSALGFLQGFCAPKGLPIIGIPSAAACARNLAKDGVPDAYRIVGDARRDRYWVADYRWDGERLHETASIRLVPYGERGTEARVYSPEPERIRAATASPVPPTARDIGLLALASPELHRPPLPLYLHPAV